MINVLGGALANIGSWIKANIDFSDLIGAGGLGMVFYGLHQWKPFLAFVIVGGIIFLLAAVNGK